MYVYPLSKEDVKFVNESIEGSGINDIDRKIRNAVNELLKACGCFYFDIDYYSTINEKLTQGLSGPFTKISVCVKPKDLQTVIKRIVEISKKNIVFEKEYNKQREKSLSEIDKKFSEKLKNFRTKKIKEFSKEKKRIKKRLEKAKSYLPKKIAEDKLSERIKGISEKIQKSIEEKENELEIEAEIKKEEKKGELWKRFGKKMDKEFLGNSYFGGICASLAIQEILEGKMKPNSDVRYLQRHLDLFTLQMFRKKKIKDFKNIKFKEDFSSKVIENFKEFLNENFGIDIAAVNGDANKEIFNETITRKDIKKDLFKEDHNLIVLSEKDGLLKNTHVIYFNPKKREIADGADTRIISIPKEYNEIEFLKAYLSKEYSNKDITILSVKKQQDAKTDVKFSSLEKIILCILRYWNLILYLIERNFYKEKLEDIKEKDLKSLEYNLSGEIKSKDGKIVKWRATPDDDNNLKIMFSLEDGNIGIGIEVEKLDEELKNGTLMEELTGENGSAQGLFNSLLKYKQSLNKQKSPNKEKKISL